MIAGVPRIPRSSPWRRLIIRDYVQQNGGSGEAPIDGKATIFLHKKQRAAALVEGEFTQPVHNSTKSNLFNRHPTKGDALRV